MRVDPAPKDIGRRLLPWKQQNRYGFRQVYTRPCEVEANIRVRKYEVKSVSLHNLRHSEPWRSRTSRCTPAAAKGRPRNTGLDFGLFCARMIDRMHSKPEGDIGIDRTQCMIGK